MRRYWHICQDCEACFKIYDKYYCSIEASDENKCGLTFDQIRSIGHWRRAEVPEKCLRFTEQFVYDSNNSKRGKKYGQR